MSPLTTQHLHLKTVLLFSVSTAILLNSSVDLDEFYEGRVHVILTLVKILGHLSCISGMFYIGRLLEVGFVLKAVDLILLLVSPYLSRAEVLDLLTPSSLIFQWKNKLVIIWGGVDYVYICSSTGVRIILI